MKMHSTLSMLLLSVSLVLTRQPPAGQEYQPDNAQNPFVRLITAALVPLHQPPPLPGILDADFATLMQVHHQTGVALAKTELAFGKDAEVRNAARLIVRDEQAEIKQYQSWLRSYAASFIR